MDHYREIRVIHEGNAFVLLGRGAYRVPRLFGRALNVAPNGTTSEGVAHAFWYPENNDAEDDGA